MRFCCWSLGLICIAKNTIICNKMQLILMVHNTIVVFTILGGLCHTIYGV